MWKDPEMRSKLLTKSGKNSNIGNENVNPSISENVNPSEIAGVMN